MTNPKFELTRHFDAPPALVWRTWTEADLVARWYGPGVETKIRRFEPEVGGLWLNEMKMGENSMFQRMEFTEVEPPSRLAMLMSNADDDWNVIASPMMPDWPRTLLTTVIFEAEGDGTNMTLTWEPHEPTDAEIATFTAALDGLDKGWSAGMDIIASIVAELKATQD